MDEERLDILRLSLIPKVGPVTIKQLIHHFGSAKAVFDAPRGQIAKLPGLGKTIANAIHSKAFLIETDTLLKASLNHDIQVLTYLDDHYPKRFKQLPDVPLVLYVKGNLELNTKKTIGVVGTRRATRYGLSTTKHIIEEAKNSSTTLISGLAFGIDVKAHESAIKEEMPNIAVLACGLDQIYPAAHRSIGKKIMANGGLVSEYPIGIKADPRQFPARNRIIAALSDVLIVVEAAKTGGALITANIAHSYDRPVFAVPGEISAKFSEGCNQLIRNFKASIYTGFDDVIRELNWDMAKESRQQELFDQLSLLKGMEKRVMEILMKHEQQLHIDQLVHYTQFNQTDLAGLLLQLEFKGLIKTLPGKEYKVI